MHEYCTPCRAEGRAGSRRNSQGRVTEPQRESALSSLYPSGLRSCRNCRRADEVTSVAAKRAFVQQPGERFVQAIVTSGNGIYTVYVDDVSGAWTTTTAGLHSAGGGQTR